MHVPFTQVYVLKCACVCVCVQAHTVSAAVSIGSDVVDSASSRSPPFFYELLKTVMEPLRQRRRLCKQRKFIDSHSNFFKLPPLFTGFFTWRSRFFKHRCRCCRRFQRETTTGFDYTALRACARFSITRTHKIWTKWLNEVLIMCVGSWHLLDDCISAELAHRKVISLWTCNFSLSFIENCFQSAPNRRHQYQ